jgi:hypothetical protein
VLSTARNAATTGTGWRGAGLSSVTAMGFSFR